MDGACLGLDCDAKPTRCVVVVVVVVVVIDVIVIQSNLKFKMGCVPWVFWGANPTIQMIVKFWMATLFIQFSHAQPQAIEMKPWQIGSGDYASSQLVKLA